MFVDLYRIWRSTSGGASSRRKVLKRQEELRVSPPSPRRQRSSLFRYSQSSSTDSDSNNAANNAAVASAPGEGRVDRGLSVGMFGFGTNHLDVKRDTGVKRKPSVHKRIMMKVMPSAKINKNKHHMNNNEVDHGE